VIIAEMIQKAFEQFKYLKS